VNALEIIDRVRGHGAELALRESVLVVRGRGPALPDDLQAEIREHKAELMTALGAGYEPTIAAVLADIRPHLPPAVRILPDASLLALVNWSIVHAWNKAASKLSEPVQS
jgi:hypothetical protein